MKVAEKVMIRIGWPRIGVRPLTQSLRSRLTAFLVRLSDRVKKAVESH